MGHGGDIFSETRTELTRITAAGKKACLWPDGQCRKWRVCHFWDSAAFLGSENLWLGSRWWAVSQTGDRHPRGLSLGARALRVKMPAGSCERAVKR